MSELTPYLPGIFAAWAIQIFGALSPGPAVAIILGVAGDQGRGQALLMCLGIACASATLALATTLGVTALVMQISHALLIIRVIGGAYLLWLAYKAFRRAAGSTAIQAKTQPRRGPAQSFGAGYLLQIANPKGLAFWLVIASVSATLGAPLWVAGVFIAGAFTISLSAHGFYALVFSAPPVRRAYGQARRWIELVLGGFLTFAAFRLATSES